MPLRYRHLEKVMEARRPLHDVARETLFNYRSALVNNVMRNNAMLQKLGIFPGRRLK